MPFEPLFLPERRSVMGEDPLAWCRDDVRPSFLAPHIHLHQALTASGQTASGVGESAEEARARTLSETAEIVVLESDLVRRLPRAFLPTRDGIAAADTIASARKRALLEACERRGISDWWLDLAAPAQKMSASWMQKLGLGQWLARLRDGADLRRRTELWHVPLPAQVPVSLFIARSTSVNGQSPILGYGCAETPLAAARKALRELLLMEIIVMDDYVERAFGPVDENARSRRHMADFAARLPHLLPDAPENATVDNALEGVKSALFDGEQPQPALIDWLAGPVRFETVDLSPHPHHVVICQPLGARPVLMAGPGSPFVGTSQFGGAGPKMEL